MGSPGAHVRTWAQAARARGTSDPLSLSLCLQFLHTQAPYCTAHLHDAASVALLVAGFTLLVPLLVLALAAYCRLARRLQLGHCLIPYSKAVYKNLPATRYHHSGCCGGTQDSDTVEKVWV